MRVPPQKPTTCNNSNNNIEPTSVLDLRRSPEKPAANVSDRSQTHRRWDEVEVLHNSDDWDSIIRDLGGLDEDLKSSNPQCADFVFESESGSNARFIQPAQYNFSDLFSNQNCNSFENYDTLGVGGFDSIEELVRAADCFDSDDLQLAQVILARLDQRLESQAPVGKPLLRAASHFKEALQMILSASAGQDRPISSYSEIVQTIKAHNAFSGISPIPMFAHFTANQAIVESLNNHSPLLFHLVDFDIGFGGQYASLLREMAEKYEFPIILVTAIVSEKYAAESRLVKENLTQFAGELNIRFQIEFVFLRTFELLSFKSIKFIDGEKLTVLLSPSIFWRLNRISGFLNDLRRASPSAVVFIDGDGWTDICGVVSFRRSFVSSLEFYSLMLESLDAASAAAGSDVWAQKIEMLLVRPKIYSLVGWAAAGRRVGSSWREILCEAGFRPVGLSELADFQAECLLRKVHVSGFHVAKRETELVLCWHGRALVTTSAWRC